MNMSKRDLKTLKEKTLVSSIDMNERDLEKLSKSELIKMLLKQKKSKKVHNHEDLFDNDPFKDEVAQPVAQREPAKCIKPRDPKTGRFIRINPEVPKPPKQPALPRLRDAKGRFISRQQSQPVVQQAPNQIRIKLPKPNRPLPPPPKDPFNFDDDIFQTKNTSLSKFKIFNVQSRQNKKFRSYTNEFKILIFKKLDDIEKIYHIFQELIKTVKRRRKLSNNDMLRLVIQNEELPNAISTKFNKVQDFKLGNLETIINILEYRAIPIDKCKIVVQSFKIPAGKGRLYLTKVKNNDTICLPRAVVTAYANLHPERWSKTQLKN